MTPPPSAHNAARARTLAAARSLRYGIVTYDAIDYCCAVAVEGEGYELTDAGQNKVQRLRASIEKCLLAERPRTGATVLYEGRAYEIELVGGDNVGDPHWSVTAIRTPGGDR